METLPRYIKNMPKCVMQAILMRESQNFIFQYCRFPVTFKPFRKEKGERDYRVLTKYRVILLCAPEENFAIPVILFFIQFLRSIILRYRKQDPRFCRIFGGLRIVHGGKSFNA